MVIWLGEMETRWPVIWVGEMETRSPTVDR